MDVDALQSDISEIKDDVKRIFTSLHGNGGDGVMTRIKLIEQGCKQNQCSMRLLESRRWDVKRIVFTIMATAVVTGVLSAAGTVVGFLKFGG